MCGPATAPQPPPTDRAFAFSPTLIGSSQASSKCQHPITPQEWTEVALKLSVIASHSPPVGTSGRPVLAVGAEEGAKVAVWYAAEGPILSFRRLSEAVLQTRWWGC